MLKNLVKKFKSQSLNEDEPEEDEINSRSDGPMQIGDGDRSYRNCTGASVRTLTFNTAPHHDRIRRPNCCPHKQATCPHHQGSRNQVQGSKCGKVDCGDEKDSGTESDEELELIETNSSHSVPISQTSDYYASQQSLLVNSCLSSHCGSPSFGFSSQKCNSWESVGSESGIGIRVPVMDGQQHQHRCDPNVPSSFSFHYEFLMNPYNKCNKPETSATPTLITEELPNHPYHTRQQFQRLKQQISMKNGDSTSLTAYHDEEERAETFHKEPSLNTDDPSGAGKFTAGNTAFSAFSRFLAPALPITTTATMNPGKSPSGSSSVDELEEINSSSCDSGMVCIHKYEDDDNKKRNPRRLRSSTASVISSSGVSTWSGSSSSSASSCGCGSITRKSWSEKRKWSQMRQQHRSQKLECCCFCSECGNESKLNKRPAQQRMVLHAARKTPVKLLYPLNDGEAVVDQGKEPAAMTPDSAGSNQKKMEQTSVVRNTRSARKKCRSDGGAKSEGEEAEEDSGMRDPIIKRPSLDFDKMRAKRVCTKSDNKSRRASSQNGTRDRQYGGYHLRSTRSQRYLFRPLDPARNLVGPTSFVTGRNLNAESASWFTTHQSTLDQVMNFD